MSDLAVTHTMSADDRTTAERLDLIAEQLAFVTAEVSEQKRLRIAAGDLVHDMTPVTGAVMGRLTDELGGLPADFSTADLARLVRTFSIRSSASTTGVDERTFQYPVTIVRPGARPSHRPASGSR